MMFANKYLDKQISYECEIFSDETRVRRLCKLLISRLYNAHTAVAAVCNLRHSRH